MRTNAKSVSRDQVSHLAKGSFSQDHEKVEVRRPYEILTLHVVGHEGVVLGRSVAAAFRPGAGLVTLKEKHRF